MLNNKLIIIFFMAIMIILLRIKINNKEYFGLPNCYTGGGEGEFGEREMVSKYIKPYNRILEFGGGAGSVSVIIQQNITDKNKHVVIQPNDKEDPHAMFGGIKQLKKNSESCNCKFTIIDHILKKNEIELIYRTLGDYPDCMVVDCEGCLVDEYKKNPILFSKVECIIVERDDQKNEYFDLFKKLKLRHVDSGCGCGHCKSYEEYRKKLIPNIYCTTEVWKK